MRTLLVVAAERYELRWIPAKGENVRFVKIAAGPGPRLVRAALNRFEQPVDGMISAGLCGALRPDLRVADVVVGTDVNGRKADLPRARARFVSGGIRSVDRVVGSASEKAEVAASGAVAVEMEAAAVLEESRRRGIPFYCIKTVSDLSNESFGLDFNKARRSDGRFSVAHILMQAVRRPGVGFPELLRLRRNAATAARALGDFVANCDF